MKKQYIIPMNYMETGYVMNGAVSIRNAVEGGVLGVLGILLCRLLPLPSGTDAITYYILIAGPLAMLGFAGIQGDPISVFVLDYFKWRKRRKPCFYSSHGEAYTQEAADMLMDAPQLRDMIADSLLALRNRLRSEDIYYVEGQTFEFAVDPEQAALKQAEANILAKRTEALQKAQEELQKQKEREAQLKKPIGHPADANSVNAEKVAQMMVLEDLEWEEEDPRERQQS